MSRDIHLGKLTWEPKEWRLDGSDILFKKGLIFRCSFARCFFFFEGGRVVELKEDMMSCLLKFCFYALHSDSMFLKFHSPKQKIRDLGWWYHCLGPLGTTVGDHLSCNSIVIEVGGIGEFLLSRMFGVVE